MTQIVASLESLPSKLMPLNVFRDFIVITLGTLYADDDFNGAYSFRNSFVLYIMCGTVCSLSLNPWVLSSADSLHFVFV